MSACPSRDLFITSTQFEMKILFLDQNKWIQLASVHAGKVTSGPLFETYQYFLNALRKDEILIPLTSANIIETSKRNDLVSRSDVARTQAEFSKGCVFRSRKARLLVEIRNAMHIVFEYDPMLVPRQWVVVPNFIRAFEEFETSVASMTELADIYIGAKESYLDYMLNQDDKIRRNAHVRYKEESKLLIERIESRRKLFSGYDKSMRRRGYAAQLFLDHQESIVRAIAEIGHTFAEMEKLGPEVFIKFIEDIPTLNVELNLAIGRESQAGSLKENDLGDIDNFYTAIPYANIIVAEKNFTAIAEQAKLNKAYGVTLHTRLENVFPLQ
jgi:hypothetical protein